MEKVKEIKFVKTNLLDTDIVYSRDDYGDISQLQDSIIENGVLTPLVVSEKEEEGDLRYMVISGNRRAEAIRQLIEWEGYEDFSVPVIIDNNVDKIKRASRIIIDNDRKPLTELELAHCFALLYEMGQSVKEIADSCGRNEKAIRDYLLLFSADEKMKAMIRKGKMTAITAIKILKKGKNED